MRHVDLARQWPRAQLPTFTAASLATTSNISNKSLEISPGQPTYQAKKGQIRHTNIRWERKVAQRIPREGGNVKIICQQCWPSIHETAYMKTRFKVSIDDLLIYILPRPRLRRPR